MQNSTKISFNTAVAIVVANMVGAGVFTSLGFQLFSIQSVFPLLMLWLVGGIVALCGALSYGELAALFPRSGGEYNFLSEIYHPSIGFLSGWVSATVGFAAPVALAAVALGKYSSSVILAGASESAVTNLSTGIALVVVLLITAIHAYDIKAGSAFQRYSTAVKVILIIGFILGGLFITSSPQNITVLPVTGDWSLVFSGGFAVSLAYVSFSYSGWNASAYLAGEIKNPQKNVPRSLFLGTLVVMIAYILLNFVFLYTASMESMVGQLDVGYVSANAIFGTIGGKIMGSMIALLLISSISAMIFAGPRVTQVMGEDIAFLKKLAFRNKKGVPIYAIFLQAVITILLILTSSFDAILKYIAFTLDIFTFMTVLGVFVMRFKAPKKERVYKTWGYPITPLIFLAVTAWTMIFLLQENFWGSLAALGTVLAGFIFYLLDKVINKSKS